MPAASSRRMTFKEYVALEEGSDVRHEFYQGEICNPALAGETVHLSSVDVTFDIDAIYRELVSADGTIREL